MRRQPTRSRAGHAGALNHHAQADAARVAGFEAKLPYAAGLDGLRAIAVLAVLLYHGRDVSGLPGILRPASGFLGVEVFFVISGYLITSLLLREQGGSGTINLRGFWSRRARRLLPGLYLLLVGVVLLAVAVGDAASTIREELVGAVLYVSNWLLIFQETSYFESVGRPSMLRHLWSLAVEEQFYLLWPLVMFAGLRWLGKWRLFALTVAGAIASTALAWVLFDRLEQYGDVTSIYYRTDARAGGLLIGAAAAFVWRPGVALPSPNAVVRSMLRRVDGLRFTRVGAGVMRFRAVGLDALGIAALAAVVAVQYAFSDQVIDWDANRRLYHAGFLFTSIPTIVLIAVVVTPGSRVGRALGNRVMRWVGLRSYGLYLWHWPVYQVTRPRVDVDFDGWTALVVRLAVTVVLAELSYRLVEMPIRERRFLRLVSEAVAGIWSERALRGVANGAAVLVAAGLTLAVPAMGRTIDAGSTAASVSPATVGVPVGTPVEAIDEVVRATGTRTANANASGATRDAGIAGTSEAGPPPIFLGTPEAVSELGGLAMEQWPAEATAEGAGRLPSTAVSSPDPPVPVSLAAVGVATPTSAPTVEVEVLLDETPTPVPPSSGSAAMTVVGDSVVLGASSELVKIGDGVSVYAQVGRQWYQVTEELRSLASAGALSDVVVIQLGNNGLLTAAIFDEVMGVLADAKLVLFVNVRVPREWESDVNSAIAAGVARYAPRARLADWYSASNEHPEFFLPDGVHLQHSGSAALRQLIESAVAG